jgi:hypothetical protein
MFGFWGAMSTQPNDGLRADSLKRMEEHDNGFERP